MVQTTDWTNRQHSEGRCVTCGYLCKRGFENVRHPRELAIEEATFVDRMRGTLSELHDGYGSRPMCYVGAASLDMEAGQHCIERMALSGYDSQLTQPEDVLAVITKDRQCPRWTFYIPYRPPEWHLEQARMVDLERLRQESQRELAKLSTEAENRHHSTMVAITILGIVLAAAQVVSAFIAPLVLRHFGLR